MSASDHLRRYFDNRRSAHAHMRNPIIGISEGVEVAPALLRNSPNDASIVSGGGPPSPALRPSRCALVFSGGSHRPLATAVLAHLWPPVIRAPLACSHRPSLPQRDLATPRMVAEKTNTIRTRSNYIVRPPTMPPPMHCRLTDVFRRPRIGRRSPPTLFRRGSERRLLQVGLL